MLISIAFIKIYTSNTSTEKILIKRKDQQPKYWNKPKNTANQASPLIVKKAIAPQPRFLSQVFFLLSSAIILFNPIS